MVTIPRRFRSANAILGFTAVVTGAVSFWAANRYVEARASAAEQKLSREYVSQRIVVAATDLPAGKLLAAQDLAARAVPVRFAASDRVSADRAAALAGRRISHAVQRGDPLGWSDFEPADIPTLSSRLDPGQRAITFPVDEVNSFSGLLMPGDCIDLLYSTQAEGRATQVVPLLQAVRVLATGRLLRMQRTRDASGAEREVEREFVTVTLHVPPADAARIVLAQRAGELTAVLRNASDHEPMQFAALDSRALLAKGPRAGNAGQQRTPSDYFDLIVGGAGGALASARRIAVQKLEGVSPGAGETR